MIIKRKIDQKFNNINNNSRCHCCSITTAAAGAVAAVFALAVAVLRACNHPLIRLFYDRSGHKILKQAKLGQFSTYSIETGPYAHENYTYNMIRPFDCTGLSSNSLKKERLCLKIVLGQA